MNQRFKKRVYKKGTDAQAVFIAKAGGMDLEETAVFLAFHNGAEDLDICADLGIDPKRFPDVEREVSIKMYAGLMHCIDFTMAREKEIPR